MPVRIYDIAKKLGIESKAVLAKAKELSRRLKQWHVDDYLAPIQMSSDREAWRWCRLTFREIT
ncbi:MAG: hypothetical protein ACK4UN_06325, partial [Limisphaerales bacterium]